MAYKNNIKLYLFFSPSHARFLETWRLTGNWPEMEAMKIAVVKANEEEAQYYDKPAFPVWDFSGYNSITTEALPPKDKPEEMMWGYWEGSHYTRDVGLYILDKVFAYSHPSRAIPNDFGVKISTRNINSVLSDIRKKGDIYRQNHLHHIQKMGEILNAPIKTETNNL